MKHLILTPNEWRTIRDELKKRHPASHFLIRSKMRERLGFTVREHRDWQANKDYAKELNNYPGQREKHDIEWLRGQYVDQVHLDFYDERKKSLFLLTYGDKIGRETTEA
jgi:hypothetical protein